MADTATDPISAAIESSISEAGIDLGGGDADASIDSGAEDTGAETGAASADSASDDDAGPAAGAVESPSAAAATEVTPPVVADPAAEARAKRLEELGLVAPKPGQKENRLPHSRVSSMVEKAFEKGQAAAQAEVAKRDTRIQQLDGIAQEHMRFNRAAETDPERLIEALAVAMPSVWKPIQARLAGAPQAAGKTAPAVESLAGKARPAPNVKLSDGSMTYDEAGLDSLLQWTTDNAVAAAETKLKAQFEERLSPLEKGQKDAAYRQAQGPKIAAQIKEAREEWGKLFEDDYQRAEAGQPSEIITYMNTHRVPFEKACRAVLLPKLRVERTTMRAEILKEINAAPAAAVPVHTSTRTKTGPRTIEQVISDSMVSAGIK